ncbi:MAG: anti-sigma factor domain-containing protein [Gudongella sp.]|nr:anti-sigma factor domain-containing protein [Gudongella sp.]
MKAVILEIIKGRAVVMKADGSVTKIRNKNYSVGDEIYMKEGIFSHRRWAPIVAALLIFAMVGTGSWVYAEDYKVNVLEADGAEFMISVNRRGEVTSVERNGEEIRFENKDIRDFLEELFEKYDIEAIAPMGDSEEDAEKLAEEIKEMIEERREEAEERAEEARERAQDEKDDDEIESLRARVENMEVKGLSPEDVERAKILGLTPGHYNIITNLMEVEDTEYDPEKVTRSDVNDDFYKYVNMTKQELMKEFSASRGEKNGVKFQEEDKEDKDNPSQFAPGQLKKQEVEPTDDVRTGNEELEDESGRPEDIGKPDGVGKPEGVGNSKGNSGN